MMAMRYRIRFDRPCPFEGNGWVSWRAGSKSLFTPWFSVGINYPPVLDRPVLSFISPALWDATAGMLLAWRNIPRVLRSMCEPMADLLWALVCLLLAVLMPFFFWLSPLLVWLDVRDERRAAARLAAHQEAAREFWKARS